MKLFIDRGISVNREWKGRSPLAYACEYTNSMEVVKLLIENGADPTSVDADGKTALDYALANPKLNGDEARKLLSVK